MSETPVDPPSEQEDEHTLNELQRLFEAFRASEPPAPAEDDDELITEIRSSQPPLDDDA